MDKNMDERDILDISHLNFQGDFYSQVDNILKTIRLSREEVENLGNLYRDLEEALHIIWRGCKVIPFGSIVTGLGIKTSDADCYVEIKDEQKGENVARDCMKAKFALMKYPHKFKDLFAITQAKVPIVQFVHIPTGTHCDASFSSRAGAQNSELISFLLQQDRRALHLAILIKYWSKVHNLTGTGLLPNYALVLMIIFYLQHMKILPSVESLQRTCNSFTLVDDWNVSFNTLYKNVFNAHDNTPLHRLLGGFFKYYRDFNFEEDIVSTYAGCTIKKKLFQELRNVPENIFPMYIDNIKSNICLPLKIDSIICVQDPFQHNRNCTMAVYPRLVKTIKAYFKLAADVFERDRNDYHGYLKEILTSKPLDLPKANNKPKTKNNKPRRVPQYNRNNSNGRIQKNNFRPLKMGLKRNMHRVPLWYQQHL